MRVTLFLLALTLLGTADVGEPHYRGPKCLGAFCVDRPVLMKTLMTDLGIGVSKSDAVCTRSSDGRAFLYIERIHSMRERAGDVLLSDFTNCQDRKVRTTSAEISRWQTPEGISLGTPEAEVIKAYGKPSSVVPMDDRARRLRILGYRSLAGQKANLGEKRLFYSGVNEISAAEFGIRNGKVSYIFLSANE